MLESFQRAARAVLEGASSHCKFEPKWSELYRYVPDPDSSAEQKAAAAEKLQRSGVTCGKLKLRPDACHGCEDNPLGDRGRLDFEALALHGPNVSLTSSLYAAAQLNLLGMQQLSMEEFEMLRIFHHEAERARLR